MSPVNITTISNKLNTFFDNIINVVKQSINKNKKKLRTKDITINNLIEFMFRYSDKNKTQQSIISNINKTNKKCITRTSYYNKEKNIDCDLYYNILNISKNFLNEIEHNFNNNKKFKNIFIFDGVFNQTSKNNDKYQSKYKYCNYTCTYNLGCYDLDKNLPYSIKMCESSNERKELIKFLKEHDFTDKLIILDAGFYSAEIVKFLKSKNIKFIIRLSKSVTSLINHNGNDYTKNINQNNELVRIIKYKCKSTKILKNHKTKEHKKIITDSDFYLVTNIFDENYDIDYFKSLYKSRWDIEEYFKLLKNNLQYENIKQKHESAIKKRICINTILCYWEKIIEIYGEILHSHKINVSKKCKKNNNNHKKYYKKFNKSNLLNGIVNDLVCDIFNEKIDIDIDVFINAYFIEYQNEKDRHFVREAKSMLRKWYYKKYLVNKKIKIKENKDNQKINKENIKYMNILDLLGIT